MNSSSDSGTRKQRFTGVVASNKMQDTLVVKVESLKRHPKYHKTFKVSKRLKVHSPGNKYEVGDKVVIESTRPISKDKAFKVISKI